MLIWAFLFLAIGLITGFLAFSGVAIAISFFSKILFFISLILFMLFFVLIVLDKIKRSASSEKKPD